MYVDRGGKDKDGVEKRTDGKGRCIHNSRDVYKHGICGFIGSIDTYQY